MSPNSDFGGSKNFNWKCSKKFSMSFWKGFIIFRWHGQKLNLLRLMRYFSHNNSKIITNNNINCILKMATNSNSMNSFHKWPTIQMLYIIEQWNLHDISRYFFLLNRVDFFIWRKGYLNHVQLLAEVTHRPTIRGAYWQVVNLVGIICSLVKIRLTDLPKPGGNYLPYYHPSGGVPEVCPYVTKYVTWRNIHAFFGELPISVKGQIKSEWIYELIDFSNYQLKNFKDFCPKNLFEAHQWFAEKNKNKNSNIQHSLKVMGSNSIYLL